MKLRTKGTLNKNDWGYASPIAISNHTINSSGETETVPTNYVLSIGDNRYNSDSPKVQSEIMSTRKIKKSWKTAIVLYSGGDSGSLKFMGIRQNQNGNIVALDQYFYPLGVPKGATEFKYLSERDTSLFVKEWGKDFRVLTHGIEDVGVGVEISYPIFDNENDCDNYLKSGDLDPTKFNGRFEGGGNTGDILDHGSNISSGGSPTGVSDVTGMVNNGIMTLVQMDTGQLKSLQSLMKAGWLGGDIGKGILSVKYIKTPGALPVNPESTVIAADIASKLYEVTGKTFNTQIKNYGLGSFTIPTLYGNFLDYEPYTSVELYLPFCGIKEISPKDVVGKLCVLSVSIDFVTGNCVYYLFSRGTTDKVLYSWNGNCSLDIAISAEDFGQKISGIVGNVGSMVTNAGVAVGTGNPVAVVGAVSSGIGAVQSMTQKNVVQVGNITSNNGFGGINYPYVIVRRIKSALPDGFGSEYGFLSMMHGRIGDLNGYTEMDEHHFTSSTATDQEIKEIEDILKSGFIA